MRFHEEFLEISRPSFFLYNIYDTVITTSGVEYGGSTPALGAGRPSSILGTPTIRNFANFLMWSTVVKNRTLIDWVEKSGADKLECMAVGSVSEQIPLGPTREVLAKPAKVLQQIFGERLGSGHVIFNPHASLWGILGRKPDPLRPGESLASKQNRN